MSSAINSALVANDAGAADQSRKEFQAQLNGLGGLGAKNIPPEAKARKLREACEGFESIFIQKMWQEMRNTVPQSGFLHGREERFWQDMYDKELATSMARAGGIGLADMMFEQLSRNLADASRSAAGTATGAAFVPTAAPLIPSPAVYAQLTDTQASPPLSDSVYEQEAPDMGAVPEAPEAAGAGAAAKSTPAAGRIMAESGHAAQSAASPAQVNPAQPVTPAAAPLQTAARREKPVHHTVQPGSRAKTGERNGLDLAYVAGREAGDKLGAGAVRPALRKRREPAANRQQVAQPAAQPQAAPAQGTPEALQAALAAASSGINSQTAPPERSLSGIVADLQARNSAIMAMNQAAESEPQDIVQQPAGATPTVRKVRYTTNIPQNSKNKKADKAIRLLNVDNVGVNSKAGQGLAAYHAAQEAAGARAGQTASDPAGLTRAAELIESGRKPETAETTFAIPPLRANDLGQTM